MKSVFASCVLLVSTFVSRGDDEAKTYILASENPPMPVGITFRVSDRSVVSNGKMKMTLGERVIEKEMNGTTKELRLLEVLKEDSIRVTFKEHREISKEDNEEPEEEVHPIEGRVVMLQRVEGKWSGKLQGEAPEPAVLKEVEEEVKSLTKSLNENVEESVQMYGTEPRKIGDKWEVDVKLMPEMEDLKIEKGKVTLTFVEVKQFNGEECAVLKLSLIHI